MMSAYSWACWAVHFWMAKPACSRTNSPGCGFSIMPTLAVRRMPSFEPVAYLQPVSRPEVARIETHLIFEHVPRPQLPVLVETAGARAPGRRRGRPEA